MNESTLAKNIINKYLSIKFIFIALVQYAGLL